MSTSSTFSPQLRVVAGPSTGTTFPVWAGLATIGRDRDCGICLADDRISLRHATLERDGTRVILTDCGSTNGTSVNGSPVGASRHLNHGDVIRLGRVALVYETGQDRSTRNEPRTRRVRMGRVILLAAVVSVLGWLATTAFTLVAGRAVGFPAWMLGPGAAVAAGTVQAIFQTLAGSGRPGTKEAPPGMTPGATRGRGVPALVAILTVLLLVGVGGYGATIGIRYGVGWLTGNEDQVGGERLVSPPAPSGASGRVVVTVTSIVNTAHFTRVGLTVDNQEDEAATLSLFHNCVLTGGGVTLQPDPFKSGWSEEVPPNSAQQGHVTFSGHLPDSAATAQLSFLHVFVFGRFGVDDSLVIRQVHLRGP